MHLSVYRSYQNYSISSHVSLLYIKDFYFEFNILTFILYFSLPIKPFWIELSGPLVLRQDRQPVQRSCMFISWSCTHRASRRPLAVLFNKCSLQTFSSWPLPSGRSALCTVYTGGTGDGPPFKNKGNSLIQWTCANLLITGGLAPPHLQVTSIELQIKLIYTNHGEIRQPVRLRSDPCPCRRALRQVGSRPSQLSSGALYNTEH